MGKTRLNGCTKDPCAINEQTMIKMPRAGSREWPWLREWLRTHLGTALRAWFGHLEVVYDGRAPLSPQQRYVFGYHPHGLFPIGASTSPGSGQGFGSAVRPKAQSQETQGIWSR